jgi:O-succinylbenzoic acid--CoA ligase
MPSKDELNKHTDNHLENNYFSVMPNIEIDINTHNCLKIKGLVTNQEWLQTNDLVELLRDETHNILGFNLLGRVDNVVNSGGLKIQIEKVERQVEEIFTTFGIGKDFQKRFIVGGLADDFWGEKLVLLIEDSTWELQQIHELQDLFHGKLAKYEIPKNIIFIDKFIETETTKINRKASLKMAEDLSKI